MIQKLVLGTIQLAVEYGINNKEGIPNTTQVKNLLDNCQKAGIHTLDTAPAYENCEEILGDYLNGKSEFKIISKTPVEIEPDNVEQEFINSLQRLGVEKLYGYLVHLYLAYTKNNGIWSELRKLKDKGQVEKIGFSLYSPFELEDIFEKKLRPDFVSVPYNIFDRRFERLFSRAKDQGIGIHIRSIFLQGLFFMTEEEVSVKFTKETANKLSQLKIVCSKTNISIAALCLNFGLLNDDIERVIIGIDNEQQLLDNIEYLNYSSKVGELINELDAYKIDDENVILPYKWN